MGFVIGNRRSTNSTWQLALRLLAYQALYLNYSKDWGKNKNKILRLKKRVPYFQGVRVPPTHPPPATKKQYTNNSYLRFLLDRSRHLEILYKKVLLKIWPQSTCAIFHVCLSHYLVEEHLQTPASGLAWYQPNQTLSYTLVFAIF